MTSLRVKEDIILGWNAHCRRMVGLPRRNIMLETPNDTSLKPSVVLSANRQISMQLRRKLATTSLIPPSNSNESEILDYVGTGLSDGRLRWPSLRSMSIGRDVGPKTGSNIKVRDLTQLCVDRFNIWSPWPPFTYFISNRPYLSGGGSIASLHNWHLKTGPGDSYETKFSCWWTSCRP